MKEVTICFSYSLKDGTLSSVFDSLDILVGWSIDGIKNTRNRKKGFRNASRLLELLNLSTNSYPIVSTTLCERKQAIPLDDLEANTAAYARSK